MIKCFFITILAAIGISVAVFAQSIDSLEYQLGAGDQIRVTVYGEEDLSGEFEIDGSGKISLPLIGNVIVGGKNVTNAEAMIADLLSPEYLINPRVNLEVLNYRPFYILGEVDKPGSYPYVNDMTVLNAVALASGFTYRANKKKIEITRKVDGSEQKITVDITAKVLPGDIIRVDERFF
ncbi:polysaccharide biosynthesis/export family protein [Kordiimonas pumila]|uniref:Polysaccharide biosynthesis/export family protein n=1 Tax=Kordiimonas pumila TaxID=2161677 RepID=A0ABV7D577_9PROT|nr:polysaccharide biosynthesis/export family protein [Kordiimonas pumila]